MPWVSHGMGWDYNEKLYNKMTIACGLLGFVQHQNHIGSPWGMGFSVLFDRPGPSSLATGQGKWGATKHPALSQPKMKTVDASQQLAGGFKTFSNTLW